MLGAFKTIKNGYALQVKVSVTQTKAKTQNENRQKPKARQGKERTKPISQAWKCSIGIKICISRKP